MGHRRPVLRLALAYAVSVAALLTALLPLATPASAAGAQPAGLTQTDSSSALEEEISFTARGAIREIRVAMVRLPLAAALGAALALRPRRRGTPKRDRCW